MNQLFTLCSIIFYLIGTTSTLPTAEVTSCSGQDVTIALSGLNTNVYRGMPYVRDYEQIKDCIRQFHYDPVSQVHTIQFRMDYSDVRFDQDGISEYHPSTSICATLRKCRSFRAGSFKTTVILPRSTGVELDGDLAVDVECSWDYSLSQKYNSTASVRLGERVTLQVVGPDKPAVWDRVGIFSLEAVSRSRHRHSMIELIRQGCVVDKTDLAALNLSVLTTEGSWPSVTFNAFRFLTDPVLQFEVTVRLCKSRIGESIKYCQFSCDNTNRSLKPSAQYTVRPPTDMLARPLEYEEIITSVYLLVPYSMIISENCKNVTETVLLEDVLLVLTSRDVTMVTVILFFILASLMVSVSTVIAYRVILHRRKHVYSLDLWNAVRMDQTPPGLDSTVSESPKQTSWMRNRLITPPPTFAPSLKFTNQITPMGTKSPSTIDGKHFM